MNNKNRKENPPGVGKTEPKKALSEKLEKISSVNIIDIWPSCATKRNVTENQIFFEKHKLKVLDEATSKLPKNVSKPILLKYLDTYLSEQLKKHNIKENDVNPVRLQIYREIFDWLIESFKTYQPLLSKIKREYELNLSILREEIRNLEPMKEMLWTLAEERDQQILNLKKNENKEIAQLKQEKKNITEKLSEQEANNITLQYEVNELSKTLKNEHAAYRKEFDSRKLLIMDINELRTQLDDIEQIKKEKETVEEEDPIMLRMALQQAKKAHAEVVKEISDTKAIFADSIPTSKYNTLDKKYNILLTEYKSTSDKLVTCESNLKSLEERFTALNQQRDFYYLKYMDLAKSAPSGGTMLEKFTDVVGGAERWQDLAGKGHTVNQLAQTILNDLKTENTDKPKDGLEETDIDSSSSMSDNLYDDKGTKSSSAKTKASGVSIKENKAVMRTMIEMMCDLPPGTLNPNFDPLSLLPILTKEADQKKDELKNKSKKIDI